MPKVYAAMKALISDENKFLILRQMIGERAVWDLPGGKIEYGETPDEALLREVREETGLEIDVVKPIGMFWYFRIENKDQVICTAFLCKIKGKIIEIKNSGVGDKIAETRWVTKKEFLSGTYNEAPENLRSLIRKTDV